MFWKKPLEAASDIAKNVASTGMKMWDNSDFTAQEKMTAYLNHMAAVKDLGTSIGRRMLLVAVIALTSILLGLAIIYNEFGMVERYNGIILIADKFQIGWAWVGANAFYFGTHLVKGMFNK